jgi:hypothetical protein
MVGTFSDVEHSIHISHAKSVRDILKSGIVKTFFLNE